MSNMQFQETKSNRRGRPFDIGAMLAEREAERYSLHAQHLNEMMVNVVQTLGFDVGFRAGQGQYLFDRAGNRYLDLLSGWGVFGIGRNHPLAARNIEQRPCERSAQSRADGCVRSCRTARRALAWFCSVSRQGFLYEFRVRSCRGRDLNSRAAPRGVPALSIVITPFTA